MIKYTSPTFSWPGFKSKPAVGQVKNTELKKQGVDAPQPGGGMNPAGVGYTPANKGSKKPFTGANSMKGLEKA